MVTPSKYHSHINIFRKSLCLILIPFLYLVINSGCDHHGETEYEYKVPVLTNDGWNVDSADNYGLNSLQLRDMTQYILETTQHNIHGILIVKNGRLVFEKYFEGYLYSNNPPGSNGDYVQYDLETDHYLASVSKSVTSVIFGAAVKEGYIESVDDLLVEILPEYAYILTGEKAKITLKHLLTMSSGLHWDEWSNSFEDPANDVAALFREEDPIAYILSKQLVRSPGEGFLYNSGGTNVLGAVLEKETGMSLLDFGNEVLFDPLNVEGGMWERIAGGLFFASGGIYLRPRELAKIGYLFLNDGAWNGHQVISAAWIEESTSEHIQPDDLIPQADGYGYQWWIMDFRVNGQTFPCFFAAGWGDQFMFIFPDQEMIIVINCGNFLTYGNISVFDLMEDYILPGLSR